MGRGDAETERGGSVKGIDLSEFDPYATPGPTTTISGGAKKSSSGGGGDEAVDVLKGLQAKQDGDQEKQEENVRVEEQGVDVDMSPTGPSQTVAARPPSKRQVQASNNNRPTTPAPAPAPAPGSTSTVRDQEASDKEKEPVFNFQGFLKDLKQKSAEPVARYLKRCVLPFYVSAFITYVLTGMGEKLFVKLCEEAIHSE